MNYGSILKIILREPGLPPVPMRHFIHVLVWIGNRVNMGLVLLAVVVFLVAKVNARCVSHQSVVAEGLR
jgi:hypothetical protein